MKRQLKILTLITSISVLTFFSQHSLAAPGTLASTPLFVSTAVEPNVFFTLDDSGSMDWEHMFQSGSTGFSSSGGLPKIGNYYRYYWNPEWYTNAYIIPPADFDTISNISWAKDLWVMRNHNSNKSYYNPDTTYTPWPGVDSSGNALYTNADPTAVLYDPNNPSVASTDLTIRHTYADYDDCWCYRYDALYIPSYFTWEDSNGDGEVDPGDTHTLYEITPSTTSYPSGRSYDDEMQNFANWFQYYRKREYSAKAAVGGVINNTDATRMGLDLFNKGHQVDLETMTSPANKLNLLDTFYNSDSNGYTPAREAFNRVGKMFESSSSNAAILSADKGGECQQNFNILMTDGFWNGSSQNLGNTDESATNDGGFDGDETESNDGGNYEDIYKDTLADVAMHFYENDLRSDLADRVPTNPGVDEAEHQHLVSYTISFGLTGTLDPAVDDPLDSGFKWPDAYAGDLQKVDDLYHAAYNARGKFLSAQNPEELETALNAAISDIAERTATAAAASVTSAKLTTESIVYLAQFNTNRWEGTIFAYKIKDFNTGELAADYEWSASEELDNRDIVANPRNILTYDNVSSRSGIPFEWNGSSDKLTTAMKNDLRTNGDGTQATDDIAKARLEYIRGDRSNEGQGEFFRQRATRLGDIVNSGPVYVGTPSLRYPDEFPANTITTTPYSDFKTEQASRTGMVYVGSNDGMLHGFHEKTGEELIAYIPSYLFSQNGDRGLHYLTEQNYTHQFYNDLTPTVTDVYMTTHAGSGWRTILISGQRGGGKGYFALDVTDPGSLTEGNADNIVMWEFSSNDDADLGYTYSRPQIALTNSGKWVAIFGNGYNQTGASGEAKLFILDIAAGLDGSWDSGDYMVISTGAGSSSDPNGLGTPALADLDGNGTIDRVYAGDLYGNMWSFDLSASSAGSWGLSFGAGIPLFTTEGNLPITEKPILSFHPTEPTDTTNEPNIMVFFGSGQYLVEADKVLSPAPPTNYFYGVWDKGTGGLDRSKLVEQTYRSGYTDTAGNPVRVLTQNAVDYTTKYGWNISLPDTGERSITTPAVRGDYVIFNSSVPTGDACTTGGYGYRFAVDIATGGTPDDAILDVNKDGVIDSEDTISTDQIVQSADELTTLPTDNTFTEKVGYTGKDPFAIQELDTPNIGRFSWQELLK